MTKADREFVEKVLSTVKPDTNIFMRLGDWDFLAGYSVISYSWDCDGTNWRLEKQHDDLKLWHSPMHAVSRYCLITRKQYKMMERVLAKICMRQEEEKRKHDQQSLARGIK